MVLPTGRVQKCVVHIKYTNSGLSQTERKEEMGSKVIEVSWKKGQIMPYMWSVIHKAVATDHIVFNTTVVEADSAKEALEFFNKYVADNKYTYKAEIKNVRPFKCYSAKQIVKAAPKEGNASRKKIRETTVRDVKVKTKFGGFITKKIKK